MKFQILRLSKKTGSILKMGSGSIAGYVIGIVVALYATAYTVPQAISALFNTDGWGTAPTAVVTLGTTVLAIMVVLGLMIQFMPQEIRNKVGI